MERLNAAVFVILCYRHIQLLCFALQNLASIVRNAVGPLQGQSMTPPRNGLFTNAEQTHIPFLFSWLNHWNKIFANKRANDDMHYLPIYQCKTGMNCFTASVMWSILF